MYLAITEKKTYESAADGARSRRRRTDPPGVASRGTEPVTRKLPLGVLLTAKPTLERNETKVNNVHLGKVRLESLVNTTKGDPT